MYVVIQSNEIVKSVYLISVDVDFHVFHRLSNPPNIIDFRLSNCTEKRSTTLPVNTSIKAEHTV